MYCCWKEPYWYVGMILWRGCGPSRLRGPVSPTVGFFRVSQSVKKARWRCSWGVLAPSAWMASSVCTFPEASLNQKNIDFIVIRSTKSDYSSTMRISSLFVWCTCITNHGKLRLTLVNLWRGRWVSPRSHLQEVLAALARALNDQRALYVWGGLGGTSAQERHYCLPMPNR